MNLTITKKGIFKMPNFYERPKLPERIENDTIILYDESQFGSKILKKVEIHTIDGKTHTYEIKRTRKGGYLFN